MKSLEQSFLRLVSIMDELREKCPWDKEQSIASLRPLTIEETYELADAILKEDWQGIKEESGDVLLHILFYATIASEQTKFTLLDVIDHISDKLVYRHPHIYGNVKVDNEEDVKRNWEKLKLKEGKVSVLSGVPLSLPAVIKATRIQEKAKQVGFEWKTKEDVWQKVEEEMDELKEAIIQEDSKHIEEEFGDLLFSLINYARFLHVDAESALEKTNQKFMKRFTLMEKEAAKLGKQLSEMSLLEMDTLWNTIKKEK